MNIRSYIFLVLTIYEYMGIQYENIDREKHTLYFNPLYSLFVHPLIHQISDGNKLMISTSFKKKGTFYFYVTLNYGNYRTGHPDGPV